MEEAEKEDKEKYKHIDKDAYIKMLEEENRELRATTKNPEEMDISEQAEESKDKTSLPEFRGHCLL